MNDDLVARQPIALYCIKNDFSEHFDESEEALIVIYATKPHTELLDVLPKMNTDELRSRNNYKYNEIPILVMRISEPEFEYYKEMTIQRFK